ncbi:MAG: SpaA isopeptide-forming pilin-related protein, partial [Oscillospiraceae bacterium]|nr:SpaA isopeptide-forming pilin-related protein [Oscillospiraceae bacterium]
MSNLLKKISNSKIIFFLLAIIIILPLLPLMSVSAAVSGMMYYEHNFELPLYGSTGCLVKDVGSISAGTAFTILEEQGTNLKVKLQNGTETTVNKTFCIINLPDVVPSIKYDITNSYGSLFKIRGANIAGITGQSLYQYGTSKKSNPRLGKSEFLVPVLFDTAIKIAAAQKAALADDYTLVIYEAYRPTYAQNKIYTAYSPLVTADIRGDYPTSWFIAPGKSNHQEGYAVDLSLAKVNSISFITLSNPAYKIADLNVMNCSMITPIHDLTVDSAIYKYQSGMVIYDKTAWQSYTKTDAFAGNADCQRLQKYMTDTGLTPFAAEWWHFNDVDARNALGDMTSITGNWELTTNASILEASAVSISPTSESISTTGTLTILSHDEAGNHIPIAHNGLPIPTTDAYYVGDDGNEYPAYCVDPDLPGVAEKGGTYDVTMSNTTIDSKILGMVLAGYPYKSLSELGVSNDWEANLATKIAIKAYLKGWAMNDLTFTDDSGARALAAAKVIYAAGMAYTGTQAPAPTVTVTATGGNTMTEDGDNLVKEYTVTSNVTIKGYSVSFKGTAPTGAQIVDINGNPKTTFASGDKFKVIIPKSSITSSGSVTLDIKGEVENNVIMYGATTVPGTQNYVLTAAPFVFENTEATATYSTTPTETTETPTEPTTQPETTQPTTPEAPTTGSLKIGKINGMTGEPVPGTKFLIEQIDGTYTTTVTVGSDGYYTITDIPKGSYKITEVYVSEPLILDTAPKSVYIDPETATEDNPIVVEFVNNQMTCVHVYKYDSKTNEPLNGAQFKLSRKDETSAIYTGITGESQCSSDCGLCKTPCNADGMICFGPLSPGWYTVSEVNPAPGYIIDPATPANQTFEVTGKETQEIQLKFDNKRRPELKIIKKDPDGNHLANVEFEIWKSGTQEKFSAKTDSNGEINIAWDNTNYPLNEGSYSIKEINVPAGYVLSDEVKEVMLVGNTLSEVVFVDPKKPGLTITKTDNDGNPLDGVTFEIWKSGTETKHSATTVGGKIVLEWDNADFPLEAGTYSIREVAVPRGYLLDTTIKEALLENGKMVTVPFTNDKRPELEIVKTDSAGKPLSGAVFTIKRAGTTTEYELTTDSSGKIVIPYDSPLYPLEPDRYIVTEKNAPEHYLLSDNNSQEVILEPNTRKTVTFVDAEKPKLTIEKYDRRGDGNGNALPLSAVTFRIWKTDGSYDQTLTTGSDGKIRITDLLPGEYHIQETATKDGYVLNTEVRTVILKGDDDVTETFYNLKRPELLIVKLDSKTGKPLANAHFQISKSDEILFQDLVTDVNGQILIPYNDPSRLLEEGTYKVKEIAPPPGYDLVLPASQNVVLRNGERTRVEFSDIRKPTLIITKLNALTKKPVPNTLYNIKWEDSTGGVHDLGNWYTDKNG